MDAKTRKRLQQEYSPEQQGSAFCIATAADPRAVEKPVVMLHGLLNGYIDDVVQGEDLSEYPFDTRSWMRTQLRVLSEHFDLYGMDSVYDEDDPQAMSVDLLDQVLEFDRIDTMGVYDEITDAHVDALIEARSFVSNLHEKLFPETRVEDVMEDWWYPSLADNEVLQFISEMDRKPVEDFLPPEGHEGHSECLNEFTAVASSLDPVGRVYFADMVNRRLQRDWRGSETETLWGDVAWHTSQNRANAQSYMGFELSDWMMQETREHQEQLVRGMSADIMRCHEGGNPELLKPAIERNLAEMREYSDALEGVYGTYGSPVRGADVLMGAMADAQLELARQDRDTDEAEHEVETVEQVDEVEVTTEREKDDNLDLRIRRARRIEEMRKFDELVEELEAEAAATPGLADDEMVNDLKRLGRGERQGRSGEKAVREVEHEIEEARESVFGKKIELPMPGEVLEARPLQKKDRQMSL